MNIYIVTLYEKPHLFMVLVPENVVKIIANEKKKNLKQLDIKNSCSFIVYHYASIAKICL